MKVPLLDVKATYDEQSQDFVISVIRSFYQHIWSVIP
jgi:hypothetical protein